MSVIASSVQTVAPGLTSIDGVATFSTITVILLLGKPTQFEPLRLAKASLLKSVVSVNDIEPAGKSAPVCPAISSQVAPVLDCH